MIVEDKIWSVHNMTMLGPKYMENTLLAWSVKSNTIYVGMLSGISKQQVVRYASLSVSVHQHQLAPNMTIADKQTHITCYIKVSYLSG